jgi:hypothetical protein
MKGLFSRTKTIRELKAIVRDLSMGIKKITRNFSKNLNIYCSWSRMNKRQLIKVVDWFLDNYPIEKIIHRVCKPNYDVYTEVDPAPVIRNITDDLGLTNLDAYIAFCLLNPYGAKNFTVEKIYLDPEFEEKYFDEYTYDDNGWIIVEKWVDNGRKIGNKKRNLIGWYVALAQEDDTFLIFSVECNSIIRKSYATINAKYFDTIKSWYHAKNNKLSHRNKAVT